jgi:hypothetical protein
MAADVASAKTLGLRIRKILHPDDAVTDMTSEDSLEIKQHTSPKSHGMRVVLQLGRSIPISGASHSLDYLIRAGFLPRAG